MTSLHIDIETFCETDLKKAGAYKYAESCEVILFAYAWDDQPVEVVDYLQWGEIPPEVMKALVDPTVTKKAFNANFEIRCLSHFLNMELDVGQWECTQHLALMAGLPLNLEQVASVLRVEQQKAKGGTALINYFCVPVKKPIAKNGFRERNLPEHNPEKWEQFKAYNAQDVNAERAICRKLQFYKISESEKQVWNLDQKINNYGVAINIPFVRNAVKMVDIYEDRLMDEARTLTGIDNPKSVAQLKAWLTAEMEEDITKLNKDTIPDILKRADSAIVTRLIEIRQESSKTSTKKYPRMLQCMGSDGRIRGVHQCYGANRTGRCAHKLIQTGNLPQGNIENIEPVRELVLAGDPDWLEFAYGPIPDTLSSLIRSALVPAPGNRFIISDFVGVESRVVAFLAGEEWVLDVARTHGKLYEMTAAKMFRIPFESITKNSSQRKVGKVATLLLGFQGGKGALIRGGALKEGVTEEECPEIVTSWRMVNLNIVAFWSALQKAMLQCVGEGREVQIKDVFVPDVYIGGNKVSVDYYPPDKGLAFRMVGRSLFFRMPSGRELVYCNASIEEGEYGPKICYWGVDQIKKKWCKLDTYGGKSCENAVQGTARDLLMHGLQNLDNAGYKIVLHVHDEAVVEMPVGQGSLEEVNRLMVDVPLWAKSLPLRAEGCESLYYKK